MSDDYVKNAMNLNTPNERRVTHHVFEQTYFTKDAIVGNSNYTFQFPETWAGLPTKRKAVGFRYAKRKVNSYFIMFEFELKAKYNKGAATTTVYPKGEVKLAVTSENLVDEVVYEIIRQMNAIIQKHNETVQPTSDNNRFQNTEMLGICGQSKKDGSLNVEWKPHGYYDPEGKTQTTSYEIRFNIIKSYNKYYNNFLQFFNQEITESLTGINVITFHNVWNRKTLYIHSDVVTNTNYLLMDREGTFYRKPSKIYQYNYNGNVFHIWLSFDGKTKANLLYENVEIALAFFADVDDNYS